MLISDLKRFDTIFQETREVISVPFLSFVSCAGPRGNGGSTASTPGYTAADGSFRLGALPGPGTLFATGPNDDFVLKAIGKPMFHNGRPVGLSTYSHANMAIDLKPGVDRNDVHLTLRRA